MTEPVEGSLLSERPCFVTAPAPPVVLPVVGHNAVDGGGQEQETSRSMAATIVTSKRSLIRVIRSSENKL